MLTIKSYFTENTKQTFNKNVTTNKKSKITFYETDICVQKLRSRLCMLVFKFKNTLKNLF